MSETEGAGCTGLFVFYVFSQTFLILCLCRSHCPLFSGTCKYEISPEMPEDYGTTSKTRMERSRDAP